MNTYLTSSVLDTTTLNLMKVDNPFISQVLPFVTGGLAYCFLSQSVKTNGIAVSNASWNVYSTVLGTATGYLIWNEQLNLNKFVGISFGLIGLYLMNKD